MNGTLQCIDVCFDRTDARKKSRPVLQDLNVQFEAGRVARIAGETGSGKTTLIHLLAGLIRPTRGEIRADGRAVSRWVSTHRDLWRRNVGIVFQRTYLIEELTVLENVLLPLVPRKSFHGKLTDTAWSVLEDLHLGHLAGEKVSFLSGGERQRVGVARAMAVRPSILLADEPTAHQDRGVTEHLKTLFKNYAKNRNAVAIIAGHDTRLEEAGFSDDAFVMDDGRLRKVG